MAIGVPLVLTGLGLGSIFSAFGAITQSQAAIEASKIRQRLATQAAAKRAEKIRREGDDFLAEQRVLIGRSGVTGESPLRLLASNAAAIERAAQEETEAGINIARLEDYRRSQARSGRDLGIATAFLLPGGFAGGFGAIGSALEASETRRLLDARTSSSRRLGARGGRFGFEER